jgi:hypothetical protein
MEQSVVQVIGVDYAFRGIVLQVSRHRTHGVMHGLECLLAKGWTLIVLLHASFSTALLPQAQRASIHFDVSDTLYLS